MDLQKIKNRKKILLTSLLVHILCVIISLIFYKYYDIKWFSYTILLSSLWLIISSTIILIDNFKKGKEKYNK